MARITLKEAGEEFGQKLPKRMKEAALRGLVSAAERGVAVVKAELIPAAVPQPVDRGLYRAGWRSYPLPSGRGAAIENLEPHAGLIEHGVRASAVKIGRAMIAALAEWAKRHGFEEPERAAWAIAKKMQERGIWGQRGLGILAQLNARLRTEIIREEVLREMNAAKGRR